MTTEPYGYLAALIRAQNIVDQTGSAAAVHEFYQQVDADPSTAAITVVPEFRLLAAVNPAPAPMPAPVPVLPPPPPPLRPPAASTPAQKPAASGGSWVNSGPGRVWVPGGVPDYVIDGLLTDLGTPASNRTPAAAPQPQPPASTSASPAPAPPSGSWVPTESDDVWIPAAAPDYVERVLRGTDEGTPADGSLSSGAEAPASSVAEGYWAPNESQDVWIPPGAPEFVIEGLLSDQAGGIAPPLAVRPPAATRASASVMVTTHWVRQTIYDIVAWDLGGPDGPAREIAEFYLRVMPTTLPALLYLLSETGLIPGLPPYQLFTHRVVVSQYRSADGRTWSEIHQGEFRKEAGWHIGLKAKTQTDTGFYAFASYESEGWSPFATSNATVEIRVSFPDDRPAPTFEQRITWTGVFLPEIRRAAAAIAYPSYSVLEAFGFHIPEVPLLDTRPPDPATWLAWPSFVLGEQAYDYDVRIAGGLSALTSLQTRPWVPATDAPPPQSYFPGGQWVGGGVGGGGGRSW